MEEAPEEEDKELKEDDEAGLEAAEVGPERPEEGTEEEKQNAEPVTDEYVIGKKIVVKCKNNCKYISLFVVTFPNLFCRFFRSSTCTI